MSCIEWPHAKGSNGYGQIWFGGKVNYVHRLVYRLYHDLDEDQMPTVVRHKCDNPSCYNIEHLEGGTHRDNMKDCVTRGRHNQVKKTHCPQGHLYSKENTYTYMQGAKRQCKTCTIQRSRDRQLKQKTGV